MQMKAPAHLGSFHQPKSKLRMNYIKRIPLFLLFGFLSSNIGFAMDDDIAQKSVMFRINVLYIDEILDDVLDGGNEGSEAVGSTVELSFLLSEIDGIYSTLGIESGYVTTQLDDKSGLEADTFLVPLFINVTFGSDIGEKSGFIWEAGAGIGGVHADIELKNSDSDEDNEFVFGGQVFASIGYGFAESASVQLGARYMLTDEADFFPDTPFEAESEVINSFAIDLSLNYTF